jgi:hypothetical protein
VNGLVVAGITVGSVVAYTVPMVLAARSCYREDHSRRVDGYLLELNRDGTRRYTIKQAEARFAQYDDDKVTGEALLVGFFWWLTLPLLGFFTLLERAKVETELQKKVRLEENPVEDTRP